MDILFSFIICISMYSIIPVPMLDWTEKKMRYIMCFFPLVGALSGLLVYTSLYYLNGFNLNFSAILTMLIPVIVSGGIHIDGLVDTCDAIFSYGDKQKKLDILKDPRTGAFGVIGAVVYFFALFATYSQVIANHRYFILIPFVYVISRSVGGICMLLVKNARTNGLGATFSNSSSQKVTLSVLFLWFIAGFVFIFIINMIMGVIMLACVGLFLLIYIPFINKAFGGITGDLTGFILCALELILPLSIAIGGGFV